VTRIVGIRRDTRGAAMLEFALLAPVFVAFVFAIIQLGNLFFASAGLKNAVGEGARLATLWPRPTDDQIKTQINAKRWGLNPTHITGPTIITTTVGGITYADITMSYAAPIKFPFYDVGAITLSQTRRVYLQPLS
jgi:Flp pilus assembly protein TadG